ncbi:MAG: hypothetical protein AAGA33_07525 [Pseudomonadota bacterium]
MKHDFRGDPDSARAQAFCDWLENETSNALRNDHGNIEAIKSSVFLYVNRAYEAGLPDAAVGRLFGRSIVKAGYSEEEQDAVFDLLESLAPVAKSVHLAK